MVLETFACVHRVQIFRSEVGDDTKDGSRFDVFHKYNRNIRVCVWCNDAGNFLRELCGYEICSHF